MEHYLTYKKLIELIQQNLPIKIKTLSTGDLSYLGKENNPSLYPLMHIVPTQITYNENTTQFTLNILFCDIVNTDMSNEVNVISDMNLACRDFLSQIKLGTFMDYFDTDLPNTSTTFLERFNDHLGGVELNIPVVIFEDMNACDQYIPEPPSPSVTPSVTITPTPSLTPNLSPSPTPSITPSITPSPTINASPTPTPSTTPINVTLRSRYVRQVLYGGGNRNIDVSCVSSSLGITCGSCWPKPATTIGVVQSLYTPYSTFVLSSCASTTLWSISRTIARFGGSRGNYKINNMNIVVRDETAGNIVVASNQFFFTPALGIPTGGRTDTMSVTFQAIAGRQYNFEFIDVIQID